MQGVPAQREGVDVEARAGDVVLFTVKPADRISSLIGLMTSSPYSHSAIALGPDEYANATPGGADSAGAALPDIAVLDPDGMAEAAAIRRLDLFRPPVELDEVGLRSFVDRAIRDAAAAGPGQIEFSAGVLAGLAVLHMVSVTPLPGLGGHQDRLRRALVVALHDTEVRLFCSEFVHRSSTAGGYRPPPPTHPFLPPRIFEPDRYFLRMPLLDRVRAAVTHWLEATFHLDDELLRTFGEVWDDVTVAYEKNAEIPSPVDESNFYVPRDFVPPGQYRHLATWSVDAGGWGAPQDLPVPTA